MGCAESMPMAALLVRSRSSLVQTGGRRREVALYTLQHVGIRSEAGPRESGGTCDTEASVLDVTIRGSRGLKMHDIDVGRHAVYRTT